MTIKKVDLTAERIKEIEDNFRKTQLPCNYFFNEAGLWYQPPYKKEQEQLAPIFICSKLDITAIVRDHANENFGRLLEFEDADGQLHVWSMPMDLLAGDGREYRKELLLKGLLIAPGAKQKQLLTEYIQLCNPSKRARCVSQTGWFQDQFILPDFNVSKSPREKLIFQSATTSHYGYAYKGTLDGWKKEISTFCKGNSRLLFAVSTAFAPPLLYHLNEESGGFHFRGQSSIGKTTALVVACSVWGSPEFLQRWRATTNGLESLAASHNDSLLCLDEIEQMSANEVSDSAYTLANGSGKTRADQFGNFKKKSSWRILFISTGEISIAEHINQSGKQVRAGQEVRILDIPADTEQHGIFENLHSFKNGSKLAEHLRTNCSLYYGIASKEFLINFINKQDALLPYLKEIRQSFNNCMPSDTSGQVQRAFNRFSLIAAAGEVATRLEITGWKEGEAFDAVKECCTSWIKTRGTLGLHEEKAALLQVRKFFEQHGESRFSTVGNDVNIRTTNRAGFRKQGNAGMEFYVFIETFKSEICNGLDPSYVAKICINHGLLLPSLDGKSTRSERLYGPKEKTMRCYRFTSSVLLGGDE